MARAPAVQAALCFAAAQYVRAVHSTGRWRTLRGNHPARIWDQDKPFVLAFWHGRLLMLPRVWPRGRAMNVLISHHRDGEIIARTIGHLGMGTVRGSTSKGGAGALRDMVRRLARGEYVAVAPDGPHGPRRKASGGIVALARLSGAPIIPCTYAVSRGLEVASWDRFVVPAPFARGVFMWGEAISVARDAGESAQDQARQAVEDSLNALTDEADRLCGWRHTDDAARRAGAPPGNGAAQGDHAPDARA